MRPISVAPVPVDETPRVTLPEPVLSPWLTYPGDQRAGFPAGQVYQGENSVGWMPYEAEVITVDHCPSCGSEGEAKCRALSTGRSTDRHKARGPKITTRVRFQMVWNNGVSIYVDPDAPAVAEGGGHTVAVLS